MYETRVTSYFGLNQLSLYNSCLFSFKYLDLDDKFSGHHGFEP